MALKTNLVALWRLNETSGNRADSFGSNTLVETGSVGSAAGQFSENAALFTTGSSDTLSIIDNTDLSMGDLDFTIGCWVHFTTVVNCTIVGRYLTTGNQREYRFYYNSTTSRFSFQVSNTGLTVSAAVVEASTFGTPSSGTWYYLTCYHDSVNNLLGISVNNGTRDTTAWSSGVYDGTGPMVLGSLASGSQQFPGLLQQVAIWKNVVKSSTDIGTIYNGGSGLAYSAWDAATGNPWNYYAQQAG